MTGAPPPPLVTPAQAASLLEQVIYEQVVECVDLDALYRLEHSLTVLVGELEGIPDERVCELVKTMMDRALRRLPDDIWRYLRAGAALPLEGCALCDEEDTRPGTQGATRHAPTRLKS